MLVRPRSKPERWPTPCAQWDTTSADDELPANRPYAEVIEERLRFAKPVVVVWSPKP